MDVEPVRGRDHHREWLARCGRARSADVAPLLDSLLRPATKQSSVERARALARIPPDPRIVAFCIRELSEPSRRSWGRTYAELVSVLALSGDPAAHQVIREMAQDPKGVRRRFTDGVSAVTRQVRLVVERLPAVSASRLTPRAVELIATIRVGSEQPPKDLADLFALVFESPQRDEPRAVLADALLEAGDPRGEFIALQLARESSDAPSKRELDLLGRHVKSWLGPLEEILVPEKWTFERGFLARCHYGRRRATDAHIGHDLWSTVEQVDVSRMCWPPGPGPVLLDEAMKALVAVKGLRAEFVDSILEHGGRLPWTSVGLNGVELDSELITRLDDSVALSAVRDLELRGLHSTEPNDLVAMLESSWGQRIERLSLECPRQGRELALVALRGEQLRQIDVEYDGLHWHFERLEGALQLSCELRGADRGASIEAFDSLLAALPTSRIVPEIHVRVWKRPKLRADRIEALRSAAARVGAELRIS